MPANIYTVFDLCEFEHQERLREVARERLAASAQRSGPSVFAQMRTAPRVAVSWLTGLLPRIRGQQRVQTAPPVAPDQPRAVPRVLDTVQGSWALVFAGLRARGNQTSHS